MRLLSLLLLGCCSSRGVFALLALRSSPSLRIQQSVHGYGRRSVTPLLLAAPDGDGSGRDGASAITQSTRGGRGRARGRAGDSIGRGRGAGRGRGDRGAAPRSVRYIPEEDMELEVRAAALNQGFDELQADMLASCARNVYAIGCEYHPNTATLLQELCAAPAAKGDAWALMLQRCLQGEMPRLRSNDAARVRMEAAQRAAAQRKRDKDASAS